MMTGEKKLELLQTLLGTDQEPEKLEAYLTVAEQEILNWRYSYASKRPDVVPDEYEMTQIHAVIAGYNISGAENQTTHSENGISREFKHSDMLSYIRAHVIPIVGVY